MLEQNKKDEDIRLGGLAIRLGGKFSAKLWILAQILRVNILLVRRNHA
jgi:hypothetical protein